MALPSQTDRSSELGRSGGASGPKKSFDPVAIALGILVVGALTFGAVAIYRSGPTDTPPTEATNTNPAPISPANTTPPSQPLATNTNPPPQQPAPVTSTPLTINQGGATIPAGSNAAITNASPSVPTGAPTDTTLTTKPAPIDVTGGTAPGGEATFAAVPAAQPIPATGSTASVAAAMESGDRELSRGNAVAARALFSRALLDVNASAADQTTLRGRLTRINDELMFGTKTAAGDALVEEYKIAAGDRLATLPRKLQLPITWELIARVNKIANPGALRIGQTLRVPRGPFHAVVSKSQYRADIYAGSPDEPEQWIFVKSFNVGLGADDGTPIGDFIVRNKMSNPSWVNPRTSERFSANDPKNPIGERWVGLEGTGPSANLKGFGLHGTIEPESIGQDKSMGCVRLGDEDVKWVYEMLVEKVSVVQIRR